MKNTNRESIYKFYGPLNQLEVILNESIISKDVALAFYKSNARQILFYLQALARIYKGIHNKKRFEKMRISFKSLEDQLGKVDYYEAFLNQFKKSKNVPKTVIDNLNTHYKNELINLKKLLEQDGWIDSESSKIKAIKKDLITANWKTVIDEKIAIGETVINFIEEIEYKYEVGILNFNDLEHGVHEFRRQIRWISIYAQALDGLFQLKPLTVYNENLNVYLTKSVLESPFNILPKAPDNVIPFYYQAPNFYALSWMIAESGNLKDEGLKTICLENALKETGIETKTESDELLNKTLGNSVRTPKQIKEEMEVLTDYFIYEAKILFRLKRDIFRALSN